MFYSNISKGSKREELPSFKGDMNRIDSSDITYNWEPPVVSTKMLRMLVDIEWEAHNDTDTYGGSNPWQNIYLIKSQKADMQRNAARYNFLVGGDTVRYEDMDKSYAIDAHMSLTIKFSQVKRSL